MAIAVLFDPFVSFNAVDISDHTRVARLPITAEMLSAEAGGDIWGKTLAGLKRWSIDLDIEQDFAAVSVDITVWNAYVANPQVAVAIDVRAVKTGGRSVTNPSFTGNVFVSNYDPVGGAHGQVLMTKVGLQGTGALSRLTA